MSGSDLSALKQKLHFQPGLNRQLVVAAPHHGYQKGCDFYTMEFASILSGLLNASLVFGDGLRPLVDLNKEPGLASSPELRSLCLDYQEMALADPVRLFLEVHGHIHGHYDLELSCGFIPIPTLPFDKEFSGCLSTLKGALNQEIERRWQPWFPLPRPSVGIFPQDQQVVMKATKTYLFQRIRTLQLGGRRIFGLHIEVYRDYKTGNPASPYGACQQALAEALAAGVSEAFRGLI